MFVAALEVDRPTLRSRTVERVDRSRLTQRVFAAQKRLRLTSDGVAHVLELKPVGVRPLYRNFVRAAGSPELDHGPPAVPGDGTRVTVYVDKNFDVVGTQEGRGPGGPGHARGAEKALTGDTAAKVKEAALGEMDGATVDRLETDAEGNAAYEAHVTKADGSRATVYVDKSFNVVGVETGR